jgi:cytochrome c oxidase subunit 4
MSDHDVANSDATEAEHEQPHGEHHGSMKLFVGVFILLLFLTTCSFLAANSFLMNTPSVGWAVMMSISCAKAALVICFFMHMLWEASWKFVLTIPASMMSIILVLMLVPDIGRRTHYYSESRWRYAAEPEQDHLSAESDTEATHAKDGDEADGEEEE